MATYVQLGAVKTWYDEHGEGEPLVLLRRVGRRAVLRAEPARAGRALPRLHPRAARTWPYPRRGGPITYQLMTDDTVAFLEAVVGQPARTWSATATAPSSRCWWRSSVRSW